MVARSPCWSCISRAAAKYRFVKSRLIQNSGTEPAVTTIASGQYRWKSRITTVTYVPMLTIRKINPNDMNRRMTDRSLMARDSS